jgi:hypothetical protein
MILLPLGLRMYATRRPSRPIDFMKLSRPKNSVERPSRPMAADCRCLAARLQPSAFEQHPLEIVEHDRLRGNIVSPDA